LSQYRPQALAGALGSSIHQTNLARNVGRDAATCDTLINPATAKLACYWKSCATAKTDVLRFAAGKTLITHARTGKTRFLGYDIVAQRSNDKRTHSKHELGAHGSSYRTASACSHPASLPEARFGSRHGYCEIAMNCRSW
jgi:hypothetical protein